MRQVVVHQRDQTTGLLEPAYAVCEVEDRIHVRPMMSRWAGRAAALEEGLNRPNRQAALAHMGAAADPKTQPIG